MDAYDLLFQTVDGGATLNCGRHRADRPAPAAGRWGWIGSAGPGIAAEQWPRGAQAGRPMFHGLTLWLPPAYRVLGDGLPAVAFFQGEGEFDTPVDPAADATDPFIRQWRAAEPHPQLRRRLDILGGEFVLLWLTEDEFRSGPVMPVPDVRRPGEHRRTLDDGPNAWDTLAPTRSVWLIPRDDPNAGLAPMPDVTGAPADPATTTADPTVPRDGAYRQPRNPHARGYTEWADRLIHPHPRSHLGGTCFPVQQLPAGLTARYLEIEEFDGLDFGGGAAQIDLESETFDWACG